VAIEGGSARAEIPNPNSADLKTKDKRKNQRAGFPRRIL
jgi:hypothetical protein